MVQAGLAALLLSSMVANGMLMQQHQHQQHHDHHRRPGHRKAYRLVEDYTSSPAHFFSDSSWEFQTFPDPTHGAVQYVNRSAATDSGLLRFVASAGQDRAKSIENAPIYVGVGGIQSSTPDRSAVRLQSQRKYNVGTLIVADIAHIPSGCGTWPALWMLNADLPWPQGGEWDIVENVNGVEQVAVTLHTTAGCSITQSESDFSGTAQTTDCDVKAANQSPNAGCSILGPKGSKSFGSAFNANGGGVFVAEWRSDGFSVWFFPRRTSVRKPLSSNITVSFQDSGSVPPTVLTESPDTSTLGTPIAHFAGAGCDWSSHFSDMRLVINTSLCGDWAGAPDVWQESCAATTGAATCEEWVQSSGFAADKAFWQFNSLRVYSHQ